MNLCSFRRDLKRGGNDEEFSLHQDPRRKTKHLMEGSRQVRCIGEIGLLRGGREPRSTVRIAWMPDDRPGTWMYHCHILEHHEAGMRGHFEVVR